MVVVVSCCYVAGRGGIKTWDEKTHGPRVAMRRGQTFEQEQEHRNVIADAFYWLG